MLLNDLVLSADFTRSNANVILPALLGLERSDRDVFYAAILAFGHTYKGNPPKFFFENTRNCVEIRDGCDPTVRLDSYSCTILFAACYIAT